MKYLINLKNDLIETFNGLTAEKVSLFIVNGEMSKTNTDVNYIARLLLIDCRLPEPFAVLGFIRKWFENHSMPIPDINFSSEIINHETYDFEIDISLTDNLTLSADGTKTQICFDPVWSEALGDFVKGNIAVDLPYDRSLKFKNELFSACEEG